MQRLSDKQLLAIAATEEEIAQLREILRHDPKRPLVLPLAIRRAVAEAQLRQDMRHDPSRLG